MEAVSREIHWHQKRRVFYDPDTGEYWVKVFRGYMLDHDYIEGGRNEYLSDATVARFEDLGEFTNYEIDQGRYLKK